MATIDARATVRQLHTAALMHKQLHGAALAAHERKQLDDARREVEHQAQRAGVRPQ